MRKLIQNFADRFVNRWDAYYKQWADAKTGKYGYTAVYVPLTLDLLYYHVCHFITLGLCNLDVDGYGRWICFDSDLADGALDKLERRLRQHGWHCIREGARPGRDGHLWLLFSEPIPGEQLRILAQAMMRGAGIADAKLEIFPKQPTPGKLGSQVRAPLGVHKKPSANGCVGWFAGPPKDINSQLIWLSQQPLNDAKTGIKLAEIHEPLPRPIYLKPRDYGKNKIDFIQYAHGLAFRKDGNFLRGACPACLTIGHDSDNNHLWVNVETGAAGCWRCGKEGFGNIVKAIK